MRVSFQELYQASRHCRRRKARGGQCQQYEAQLLDQLVETQQALQSLTWRPAPGRIFVVYNGGKYREIYAPAYADRVVHHRLVAKLQALIEPKFIYDCAATIKGKGTHFAVARLQRMMRQLQATDAGVGYYLQLDIANFFYRIYRPVLYQLLANHVHRAVSRRQISHDQGNDLLWLCERLLSPAAGVFQGSTKMHARLPGHKQLLNAPPDHGIPIGNLTSQFFSNVYLNELDQFVKHRLRARYYVRYVDDFILLHRNPATLRQWQQQIEQYLAEHLKLALKAHPGPQPLGNGTDFFGYVVWPHNRIPRRRILHNWRSKLDAWWQQHGRVLRRSANKPVLRQTVDLIVDRTGDRIVDQKVSQTIHPQAGAELWLNLSAAALDQLHSLCSSYVGHIKHASCQHITLQLVQDYPWLAYLFWVEPGGWRRKWCLPKASRSRGRATLNTGSQWHLRQPATTFNSQVSWFVHSFARDAPGSAAVTATSADTHVGSVGAIGAARRDTSVGLTTTSQCLIQRGKCFMQVVPANNPAGWIARDQQPLAQLATLRRQLRQQRISYIWVSEQGHAHQRLKHRQLRELYVAPKVVTTASAAIAERV